MEPIRLFQILSRTAVDRLLHAAPGFGEFLDRHLMPGGLARRFPNGAVEIDFTTAGDELWGVFRACADTAQAWGFEGRGIYPPIGPFSSYRRFCIQYSSDYQKKFASEVSFSAGRGQYRPPSAGEYELDRLEVVVGFRRKPPRAARRALAAAVAGWAEAAGERGAFDDGPIALASAGVSFNNVRAWFRVDARRSGQDTLNWLALTLLDFGEDVHTVIGVDFGEDPKILDLNLGPIEGDIFEVSFAEGHAEVALTGPGGPGPLSHVPADARRAPGVKSKKFPILALPCDEWDRFTATVYFGRPFQQDERENLSELIRAWLLLCSYGGLGGVGSHNGDEAEYDDARNAATFGGDMGDVDPRVALKVLIKALEGYQMTGPPIDAVVFGKRLLDSFR